MRKNKDNKTIKAILVGISAILAISTPLTVYAEGLEGEENTNNAPIEGQSGEQSSENPSNNENAAPDAYAPVATEITESNTEIGEARTATDNAAQPIIDGNIGADKDKTGKIADAALDKVNEEANKVDPDTDPGKNLDDAKDRVADAKDDVDKAKAQDVLADVYEENVETNAKAAAGYAEDALQSGADALKIANDAEKTMDEVVDDIDNADTIEEAQAAQKKLNDLIADTENDITGKKAEVAEYEEKYNAAVDLLKKAKANYELARSEEQTNLGNAEGKVDEALTELKAAQTNVDNLKTALDNAKEKLGNEADGAQAMSNAYDAIGAGQNPDYIQRRTAMMNVVINYVLPQEKGTELTQEKTKEAELANPGDYTWHFVRGFDFQDNNYCELIYLDAEGNTVKKYYNYDMLNKPDVNTTKDRYNIGKTNGVFAFEKTQEEIDSNAYLYEYFGENHGDEGWYKDGVLKEKDYYRYETGEDGKQKKINVIREKANNGEFDVYKFTKEDGSIQFLVKEEFSKYGVTEENGKLKIGDNEVVRIVQNQNNLYHDANVFMVAIPSDVDKYTNPKASNFDKNRNRIIKNALKYSQGTDEKVDAKLESIVAQAKLINGYLSDGHISELTGIENKYAGYIQKVVDAKQEVTEANTEVTELKSAITTLKNNQAGKKTLTAAVALGTSDVAKYLGIKVTLAEDIAKYNNMTIDELIEVLDQKLTDAKADVASAEKKLQNLKDQVPALSDKIDDIIEALTPPAVTPTPSDDNPTNPAGGVTTYVAADDTAGTTTGLVAQGIVATGTAGAADDVVADNAAGNPQNEAVLGATRDKVNKTTTVADDTKKEEKTSTPVKETKKSSVTIGDEDTAKAALPTLPETPEEKEEGNWLWLIFIGFLTAIGLGAIFGFASRRKEEETVENK